MEKHVFLTFMLATTVMIAMPGPSVLLTVAHSISHGWKRALSTVAGSTAGIAVQLAVAAIGLASLLNSVAVAFEWIRWAGAVYLVYLGIKQWRSAGAPMAVEAGDASNSNLFVQGLAVTVPNPKSLIFIAAFLPQFIDPSRPMGLQLVEIVPTFLVIATVVTAFWALAAGKASGYLKSPKANRRLSRGAGGLMVAAGMGLAFARKTS